MGAYILMPGWAEGMRKIGNRKMLQSAYLLPILGWQLEKERIKSSISEIYHIGYVPSALQVLKDCPKQGDEGAPVARLHIDPAYTDALLGIKPGSKIVLLTWLDRAD